MDINNMTSESILDDKTFCEIMDIKDPIIRQRLVIGLTEKAKSLGVKLKFQSLLKSYMEVERQEQKALNPRKGQSLSMENFTEFGASKYPALYCGNWIADRDGIRTFSSYGEVIACYHPILPVARLINQETGMEKIVIAFCKGNRWREITVDKSLIASSNKIVALADLGVSVTSESAKFLVKYLADIENFNIDVIPERASTSKMGWIDGIFMPYTSHIAFDAQGKFKDTYESIVEHGSYDEWLKLAREIRATKRIEPKLFMAASFASVLIKVCNALPCIVNLWGETENGKSVTMMLATSIWADPTNNRYISDYRNTDVALEVKLDFLNHLPLMVDDTASVKEKYKDNFSSLIYAICSGKGKGRSNKLLGMNKENTWKNITLSTGEHPLSNENLQGGAMNRVLDLESDPNPIFKDPRNVVSVISGNYGHAGKQFTEVIQDLGDKYIQELQQGILSQITKEGKMLKQSLSLSVILTADQIATEHIFQDGEYLKLDEVERVLVDRQELSEHERCYNYIMGEVAINANRFQRNTFGEYQGEVWGERENDYIWILNNVFDRICVDGGFSSKAFLSWADRKGLLQTTPGRKSKKKRIAGSSCWCICIKQQGDGAMDAVQPLEDAEGLPFE